MKKASSQKETGLIQKIGRPVSHNIGFTLVELIVVITILAILGTIAIMAFSGYSKNARDSARISDLSNIKKSLELWILQSGTYPEPSDASQISYSGGLVWSQGTFGESVYNTVGKLDKKPKDPLYDVDYTYSVTQSKKEYQIGAVLEGQLANAIIPQTYAASEAKAYILGTYNGILATTSTTPVYILALPSIILSDINDADLKTTTVSLSYEGKDNLPSSYNETSLTMTGTSFTFTPIEVWSGTTLTNLNDQSEFQVLVANLQDTYKGNASFSSLPEYNSIAGTSDFSITAMISIKTLVEINTGEELTAVSTTPVFNDCDFNGTTVLNGNSVTAYLTTTVPFGQTCTSQQRTCNNANLSGTYTNTTCSVDGATGTFTLSQTSVTQGTNVTITNNCSVAPTSYTSSNPSIATISGNTITTLLGGTTNITPVGGVCGDSALKTLTVEGSDVSSCLGNEKINGINYYPGCDLTNFVLCTGVGTGYVIAACNVGATSARDLSAIDTQVERDTVLGKYFQWGRNKGFLYSDTSESLTTIDGSIGLNAGTDQYGFIRSSNWANTNTSDNWGGITNTNLTKKGPCADGYHIPTISEWSDIRTRGWGTDTINMMIYFKMPDPGFRDYNDGIIKQSSAGWSGYWAVGEDSNNGQTFHYNNNNGQTYFISFQKGYGMPVRCIKN